jgi:plasmid stability protein
MAEVLVRGLAVRVIEALKRRARQHGRSLQGELKLILERAAGEEEALGLDAFLRRAEAVRRKTAGRVKTDSADLVREDRAR